MTRPKGIGGESATGSGGEDSTLLDVGTGVELRVTVACDWCGMLSLSGTSCEWCGSPFREEDLGRMARNASEVTAALRAMERRLETELRRAARARDAARADEARRQEGERELRDLEAEDARAAEVADRLADAAARRGRAARQALLELRGLTDSGDEAASSPQPRRIGRGTHSSP
jgi:hypothetical protein